uniref:Uncharacterized protein n=1 Tax=Meloidogyne enterolobii TaxID=390850 RepID=A0A6V7TNV4_MELEN|nr:unnamed protein product [Meloidogyne enterolobii]
MPKNVSLIGHNYYTVDFSGNVLLKIQFLFIVHTLKLERIPKNIVEMKIIRYLFQQLSKYAVTEAVIEVGRFLVFTSSIIAIRSSTNWTVIALNSS